MARRQSTENVAVSCKDMPIPNYGTYDMYRNAVAIGLQLLSEKDLSF